MFDNRGIAGIWERRVNALCWAKDLRGILKSSRNPTGHPIFFSCDIAGLKRGIFRSLQELKDATHSFIDDTNANPKPFIWTKVPNKMIAAVRRVHQVLDSATRTERDTLVRFPFAARVRVPSFASARFPSRISSAELPVKIGGTILEIRLGIQWNLRASSGTT